MRQHPALCSGPHFWIGLREACRQGTLDPGVFGQRHRQQFGCRHQDFQQILAAQVDELLGHGQERFGLCKALSDAAHKEVATVSG